MLISGLFFIALGVAFSIKANLGTSPIACMPYVLSITFPFLTVGGWTIVFNSFLLLFQILILRKDFEIKQLLQLLVLIVFGYLTDLTLYLVEFLNPSNYISQWVCCLVGLAILSFGVFMEVYANLISLPPDGFVMVLSEKLNKEFGRVKPFFDCTVVILAIIVGLFYSHNLIGVREGTVVAAILIGNFVKFYKDIFGKYFNKFLN